METPQTDFQFDAQVVPVLLQSTPVISPRHLLMIAVALISLWVRSSLPVTAIGASIADDALFIQLARNFAAGHWLGPFYNMTLVKGPAYPIFIALSFWIGVPLKITETLLYLGTAYLTAECVRRLSRSSVLSLVLFTALALNPVLWTGSLARVIREGLYISLSLAVIVATLWIGVVAASERRRSILAKSVVCGSAWAAFWLTREEGGWIIPSVAVVILGCLVHLAIAAWHERRLGQSLKTAIASYGVALIVMFAINSGIASVNKARYGFFETVEVKSAPFQRAYGALSRVRPLKWQRYVVFPKDVRDHVYQVSPAARELSPLFDGPIGERWREIGCAQTKMADCHEILSGWFQWALRDSVAAAGHYSSASEAAIYYTKLANQINAACAQGKLSCLPERATLVPPFRYEYLTDAARVTPTLFSVVLRSGVGEIGAPPSVGTAAQTASFTDMVGPVQSTEAEGRRFGLLPKRDRLVWRLADIISHLYQALLIVGIPFTMIGLCACTVESFRKKRISPLALLALSCAVGVASRIALLAYLEVTSIPSLNVLYASPASPLLITTVVIGVYLCVELVRRYSRGEEARTGTAAIPTTSR